MIIEQASNSQLASMVYTHLTQRVPGGDKSTQKAFFPLENKPVCIFGKVIFLCLWAVIWSQNASMISNPSESRMNAQIAITMDFA